MADPKIIDLEKHLRQIENSIERWSVAERRIGVERMRKALIQKGLAIELQDDFRFLLISLECVMQPKLTEGARCELGREINCLMPIRDGELTCILNFACGGKVEDSYFGGLKVAKNRILTL